MRIITQEAWIDAVIEAWKKKFSLGYALVLAAGIGKEEKITGQQWEELASQVEHLKPSVTKKTSLHQPIAAWIAKNYAKASDAFWADKFELAKQRLLLGRTKCASMSIRKKTVSTIKKEDSDLRKVLIVNNMRERDQRSNWKKVK